MNMQRKTKLSMAFGMSGIQRILACPTVTAIPVKWETNEGSPNIAPRFSPWEGIQSMAQGGETE